LPDGLVGLYDQELFPPTMKWKERKETLHFFLVFAIAQKEISADFTVAILGDEWFNLHDDESKEDKRLQKVNNLIQLHSKRFSSAGKGNYRLYHERFRVYVLQKVSEKEITQFNDKFIELCEKLLNDNANKSNYAWQCYSNHLLYDCIISNNFQSRNKLFQKAIDHEFIFAQIKILGDLHYSNLLMYHSLKSEMFFSKIDYNLFIKNIETLFQYRSIFLNSNLEYLESKFEAFIISKDLEEIIGVIGGIADYKVRSLFTIKLITICAINELDLKEYFNLIFDFLQFKYSQLLKEENENIISAILISYAEKFNLNELTNYVTSRRGEEELKNMSPTKIVFEDMFFYDSINRIKKIKIDFAKQQYALTFLDDLIKKTFDNTNSCCFDYSVNGINYDLVQYNLLKENLYPEISNETKKAEIFLIELTENFRFNELIYLLESFHSFERINKISVLVWLLKKNQNNTIINYSLKIIIVNFLSDYLDYVNLDESKTSVKYIIDYVLNKLKNINLSKSYEGCEILLERIENILRQIGESELNDKFQLIINNTVLSIKPVISNCIRLKALISRTGVSPSLRQSVRIESSNYLYSNVRIKTYMEEIEGAYYHFLDLFIGNYINEENLQLTLQNIKNPYWKILALIDTVQNKSDYIDKIEKIRNLIFNTDFGSEEPLKISELLLEVLCLDSEFGQKQDFIDDYFKLLGLKSIKQEFLKCANNLINFFDVEFVLKVISSNLKNSNSYMIFIERCFSAYFKNIEEVESEHENLVLELIFENQQLLNKYNQIRNEEIQNKIQKYYSLANNLYKNSYYSRALNYYKQLANTSLKSFGRNFSDITYIYNNMGNTYYCMHEYVFALRCFKKCIEIEKLNYGETRPEIITFYKDTANTYGQLNYNSEKIKYLERVLEVQSKLNVLEKTELATTFYSIGAALVDEKDYDKALHYYEKSLNIYKENSVVHHSEIANLYFNMGNLWEANCDFMKAIEFYKKCLELEMNNLGLKHQKLADTYYYIGQCLYRLKNYKHAIEAFSNSFEIAKKGAALFYIAQCYESMSLFNQSLNFFIKSAEIRKERIGIENENTIESISNSKRIAKKIKKEDYLPDWMKSSE
jgi:tetratricopeptide (TPR) repeat protein